MILWFLKSQLIHPLVNTLLESSADSLYNISSTFLKDNPFLEFPISYRSNRHGEYVETEIISKVIT